MNYRVTREFDRDFKKLSKKYRTLDDDLRLFKKILLFAPLGNSKNFAVLTKKDDFIIVKARLFCRCLKNNSLRIIYACKGDIGYIELISIEFIELYFKGDKEREDKKQISSFLKNRKSP